MAKKGKKVEVVEAPVVEEIPLETPPEDDSIAVLEARQKELLDLLDLLDRNKFSSRGHVENELSVVNRDILELRGH